MSQGVGVGAWQFASPDFPVGASDYASVAGDGISSSFVGGPYDGGDPTTVAEATGTGPVHISTGGNSTSSPAGGRAQHWSNALDWRQGPLFWLAIATILYFGLISLHVGARAGKFRIGAGN